MRRGYIIGVISLAALFMTSCHSGEADSPSRFGRFYLDELKNQSVSERRYQEVSFEKLFVVPTTTGPFLYAPGAVFVDHQGYIYVVDYGVMKIQRLSPSGEYLTTYGIEGAGEGPGEFLSITDFGIRGDSLVYLVDSYKRKIVSFSVDGTFLEEKSLREDFRAAQPVKYKQTATGREYVLFGTGPVLLETRSGGDIDEILSISSLVNHETMGSLGTEGWLNTYGENLVYLLSRYPLLLQYRPDGSLVYARTTVDFGDDFKEPEVEERILGGLPASRLVGHYYHLSPVTIEKSKLFVYSVIPPRTKPSGAIDVYDVTSGDYLYSMYLPEGDPFSWTIYQNERVYQVKDSTVVVWKIKL